MKVKVPNKRKGQNHKQIIFKIFSGIVRGFCHFCRGKSILSLLQVTEHSWEAPPLLVHSTRHIYIYFTIGTQLFSDHICQWVFRKGILEAKISQRIDNYTIFLRRWHCSDNCTIFQAWSRWTGQWDDMVWSGDEGIKPWMVKCLVVILRINGVNQKKYAEWSWDEKSMLWSVSDHYSIDHHWSHLWLDLLVIIYPYHTS